MSGFVIDLPWSRFSDSSIALRHVNNVIKDLLLVFPLTLLSGVGHQSDHLCTLDLVLAKSNVRRDL